MTDSADGITILVIDDEEIVRQSLCDQLEDMGYKVIAAEHGRIGLEKIKQHHPDLVLTDMRMPELGGREVIANSQKIAPHIPIIVISGAGRLDDAVEALRLGAYDYLVKPIKDIAVLKHVVNKALEHYRLIKENRHHQDHLEQLVEERTRALGKANRELSEHRQRLEEEVQARTQELQDSLERLTRTQDHLIESEKMASLGNLVAGVAHELNTPIGVCVTAASFLQGNTESLHKIFEDKKLTTHNMEDFFEGAHQTLEIIGANLKRSSELIKSFKLVAVDVSSEKKRSFNFIEYLSVIMDSLHPEIMLTKHKINIQGDNQLVIEHYPGIISQIISNLVMNALQHAFVDQPQGEINIEVHRQDDNVHLTVKDNGQGMDADIVEHIFEPFYTRQRSSGGAGLGLFILYNLVTHSLGGQVSCRSEAGQGSEFNIVFPVLAR